MKNLFRLLFIIFILSLAVNVIHAENSTASYSNLTDEISASHDNATLNLTSNYRFNNLTDDKDGVIISKNITINANNTSLDGAGQARGFLIMPNCRVTINNLTIKNCLSNNDSGGGAIFLSSHSNLTLKNCIFQNNRAYNANGAAISCQESTNTDIRGCTFSKNTCIRESSLEWDEFRRGMGSAVFAALNSTLSLYDSVFKDNQAYISTIIVISYTGTRRMTSTLYVRGCLFENNTAGRMSAIYLDEFGKCDISDSVFKNNRVSDFGGTVCFECCLSSVVRNCIFESNSAVRGGGLYIIPFDEYKCTARIIGCTFLKNVAKEHGGAVYTNDAVVEISNCNFNQNQASGNGGGIFTYLGSVKIENSNFISNRAKRGGGAYFLTDSLSVRDLTFKSNSAEEICGGVFSKSPHASVLNCNFISNSARDYADVYGAFFANAVHKTSYYGGCEVSLRLTSPWVKSSQTVRLIFSGPKTYKSKWLKVSSNGVFNYKVPFNLKCGKYTLKIISSTGECYSNTLSIKIIRAPVKALLKKTSAGYNSGKVVKIKIVNSKTKRPVRFARLKVKVYTHKKYRLFTLTSDKNGIARFDTSGLSVGKHAVKVLAGDGNIRVPANSKSVIKITKGSCRIIHPKKIKKHSNLKVKILKKSSKRPLSKVKFNVKINYRYYKAKTDSGGILKIPTSKLSKGKYKVRIFLKNENYKISSKFSIRIK